MSEINYIPIKQKDGYVTRLTHYACSQKPKASLLILHGMAEHQKRYQHFSNYMVEQGYDVYTYDHRGHGTDKKLSDLGFIAPENGYQLVIEDAITISEYIEQNNRCSRFYLLGHSMGSLITRNIIHTYDKYTGVILSGTTHPPKLLTESGLFLSGLIKRFKGARHVSPYLNNLMFGRKKYTSLSTRTAYDWLSRSNPIVGAYMHDPYCGYTCTASFYHDLIKLTKRATNKKLIGLTKRELPLYIISGEKDPVGGYGKEVRKFLAILKKYEFKDVTSKIYPECRHELLNELNNQEVYSDIVQWMAKKTTSSHSA